MKTASQKIDCWSLADLNSLGPKIVRDVLGKVDKFGVQMSAEVSQTLFGMSQDMSEANAQASRIVGVAMVAAIMIRASLGILRLTGAPKFFVSAILNGEPNMSAILDAAFKKRRRAKRRKRTSRRRKA